MAAALALGRRQVLHPDGALGLVGRGTAVVWLRGCVRTRCQWCICSNLLRGRGPRRARAVHIRSCSHRWEDDWLGAHTILGHIFEDFDELLVGRVEVEGPPGCGVHMRARPVKGLRVMPRASAQRGGAPHIACPRRGLLPGDDAAAHERVERVADGGLADRRGGLLQVDSDRAAQLGQVAAGCALGVRGGGGRTYAFMRWARSHACLHPACGG